MQWIKKVHCGTQSYRSLSGVLKLDLAETWSVSENPLGLSDVCVYRRDQRECSEEGGHNYWEAGWMDKLYTFIFDMIVSNR